MGARAGLVLLAAALLAGACTGGDRRPAPTTTEPTTTLPPTTAPPTTAFGRPRTTTTEPPGITGGRARIQGQVVGPQGPVTGATVRVERLVGAEVSGTDLEAGAGGTFSLGDIRGGRYRVRAWKQPDLVQLEPQVFFLAADEARNLDLRMEKTGEAAIRTTTEPSPPPADDVFAVTVFLYAGSVGSQGQLVATPRAGVAVQILSGPGFAVVGGDRGTTDSAGNVSFRARCTRPGPPGGDVAFSTFRLPLDLPACPG